MTGEAGRRLRPDGAHARAEEGSRVTAALLDRREQALDAVRARAEDPVVAPEAIHRFEERLGVWRIRYFDRRDEHRFGAAVTERVGGGSRLFRGARHEHALAEERPRVVPAHLLAQVHDLTDDDHGGVRRGLPCA